MATIYIPVHLRRALNSLEIDFTFSLLAQITKNYSEQVPTLLYHYTDGYGLHGILESGSLWLTDVFSLNDPTELRHGIDTFLASMREHTSKAKQDLDKFMQNLEEMLTDHTENVINHFICSFSQTGEDLGQWRAYADNGCGYALAFDGQLLYDAWLRKAGVNRIKGTDKGLRFAFPVIYEKELLDQGSNRIITKLLEVLALTNAPGVKADAVRLFQDRVIPKVAVRVVMLSILFKHAAYKNEDEFRFLQLLFSNSLQNVKYRNRPYSLVRYLEWNWRAISPKALRKIIVGPSADWNIARQFARDCLRAFHPARDIEIVASEIPYRGPIT
jgi:hypothetical protein